MMAQKVFPRQRKDGYGDANLISLGNCITAEASCATHHRHQEDNLLNRPHTATFDRILRLPISCKTTPFSFFHTTAQNSTRIQACQALN